MHCKKQYTGFQYKLRSRPIRARSCLSFPAPITAIEAVIYYKELNIVQQGFPDLKDVIDMRPIYH